MSFLKKYHSIQDLPQDIPLFPLEGVLLLPRGQIPLNIFEPRYLRMLEDALAGPRLVGMLQPQDSSNRGKSPDQNDLPAFFMTGCVGCVSAFAEADDDRVLVTLTGVCRFNIIRELTCERGYRRAEVEFKTFETDLVAGYGEDQVSRERLLDTLRRYLKARDLSADWESIQNSDNESLINSLSMIAPFGPQEKQALLEAHSLEDRTQMLIAITEMLLAREENSGGASIQ